jgi:alpha-beta hydrolase superfamily lysophospholipase
MDRGRAGCAALCLVTSAVLGGCLPGRIGARLIFVTEHNPVRETSPLLHEEVSFAGEGEGVVLRGWLFRTTAPRRGTVVFLHGRNQNREASLQVASTLVERGYDVLAYDSRAHGESTGTYSTFGYYEKRDLSRAIDYLGADEVLVMGVSLGGAVALQAAAEDPRISGVIAISSFTSMQQIVRDQIPWVVPTAWVRGTVRNAGEVAHVRVEDVDTVRAARRIHVPVLLLHGAEDRFAAPAHSRQIDAALAGPHELVLVEGAHHNDVLPSATAWTAIDGWLASRSREQISRAPTQARRRVARVTSSGAGPAPPPGTAPPPADARRGAGGPPASSSAPER